MIRILLVVFCGLTAGLPLVGAFAEDYRDLQRTMAMIRHDKFDYVLPQAMRNNNIDMWINGRYQGFDRFRAAVNPKSLISRD